MKKYVYWVLILFLTIFAACNDENPVTSNNTNMAKGFDQSEATICLTLSSLAYVNENNTAFLRDSLRIQLRDTGYATGGNWLLDWGPALSPDRGNLMYVTKNTTTMPPVYAIAIRGTDWCFPSNWKEDILVWDFVHYPYGSQFDSVARGTMLGLNSLLGLRDSATGKTLTSYLNNIQGTTNYIYITGHSLGGALATILTSWFLDNGYGSRFKMKSYTFAAPSIGNSGYADHYNQIINSTGSESHRVINPKDLVPRFQGELDSVIFQQIPTFVPLSVGSVLIAIDGYFKYYNMSYEHVGVRQTLGTIIPGNCPSGNTFENYKCWVSFEHHPNTYLTLLNAPNVHTYYNPCDWSEPVR